MIFFGGVGEERSELVKFQEDGNLHCDPPGPQKPSPTASGKLCRELWLARASTALKATGPNTNM